MDSRTYGRGPWEESRALWDAGEFSEEWRSFRYEARMRGILYPPSGTRWDSWADDEPSQRAILIRAIRETPSLLHRAIARSRTWSGVIAIVLQDLDNRAYDLDRPAEVDEDRPTHREAVMALGAIVKRIGDSI